MLTNRLATRVEEFVLPSSQAMEASVAIPTVKGTWNMKYGEHAYYFMNLRDCRGTRVCISHLAIMRPGMARLRKAAAKQGKSISVGSCLSPQFHYGFNLLEQLMLMTVPHTCTAVGNGRFVVNLWSWCGYLLVDVVAGTVMYHTLDDSDEDAVLGSQQWFDQDEGVLYAMSYSLSDSLARVADPFRGVDLRIFKHKLGELGTETVWQGELSDYMHDIIINETKQYGVACELGMHLDAQQDVIPSKVIVIDLKHGKEWVLDRFIVAAHAFFDPEDPNVVYFSNHNFEFQHSNLLQLLQKGSYSVKFIGPASIYKYELTPEGPREIGVFTQDDFYRLTNMHVFNHRGRKVIVAMGFPDVVFLIDAETMSFIRKLHVADPVSLKRLYSKNPSLIGTIAPSPDGEKLFVQTTGSFQIIDIASGLSDYARDYFFGHICFNHMQVSADTTWGRDERV